MKKITLAAVLLLLISAMTGCGETAKETSVETKTASPTPTQSQEPIDETSEATTEATTEQPKSDEKKPNILIAYFTWAENTNVENPDEVDTDASTSASVLLPGNAAKMAGWIQGQTDGELFSIVVKEPYSSDYDECLDRAAQEEADDARPELATHVENMEQYDVVFLGFPNWWYTVPMAIHSFLEEYDFAGKTVIPFCTHGTGGLASTMEDIEKDLPDSVEIKDPIGIYRDDVDSSQKDINKWLADLGYKKGGD